MIRKNLFRCSFPIWPIPNTWDAWLSGEACMVRFIPRMLWSASTNPALLCPLRVSKLQAYEGLRLVEIEETMPGDIVVIAGMEDVAIGDTICTKDEIRVLPRLRVDEPTVAMRFTINTSPLAGRDGKNVQSRKIRDRLLNETLLNVAIRVEESEEKDSFIVKGRGEFQMAILIETMPP